MNFSVYYNKGKTRAKNEDNYLIDINEKSYSLIAVADGMGGYQAGEVASKIAIDVIGNYAFDLDTQIDKQITMAANQAHQQIVEFARQHDNISEMGTTLTFGLIYNYKLYIGHVGDSRMYLFRDHDLQQVTTDHSLVNELLKHNSIKPEEAFDHPQKNLLTQALGLQDEPVIEVKEMTLHEDDLLLFCTDGLSDMLRFKEIKNIIENSTHNAKYLSRELGKKAMAVGGKDNLTLIVGIIN